MLDAKGTLKGDLKGMLKGAGVCWTKIKSPSEGEGAEEGRTERRGEWGEERAEGGGDISWAEGEGTEKLKGIDLDTVGDINGTPVLEVDILALPEKPWRLKGVNHAEYFNYGFNEETFRVYQVRTERNYSFWYI